MKPFDVYPLFDIEPVKGEGVYVWDKTGEKYLDLYGGHAVISIGHSHPTYVKSIEKQLNHLVFYSNSVQNSLQEALSEKLGKISAYEDYDLFLCNSGAEANENALKLASFHTGRSAIVAFKKGFHGRTSAAVAATDNASIQAPVNKNHEVIFLELGDIDGLRKVLGQHKVCAVIVEGIMGVGGIYEPEVDFLQSVQTLCEISETILILDEVQSGYGRSGRFFAHQYAGIRPDIITVAKGMGNGFPIGGVLISSKFKAVYGMLGTTFGGNHLACAAGLAVLEVIEKELLIENAEKIGEMLMKELRSMEEVKEVRGKGLMIGIEMDYPTDELRKKLLKEYKIFTGSASNKKVIRLLPPLSLTEEDAKYFLTAFKKLTSQVSVS